MESRQKQYLKRLERSLESQGLVRKRVYEKSQYGIGDCDSYFDMVLDLNLNGKSEINAQEVWEEMKKQINFLSSELTKASEDYTKLFNKNKDLEEEVKWLRSKKIN